MAASASGAPCTLYTLSGPPYYPAPVRLCMPLRPLRTSQSGNAPFVQPFLHALDRMQARETLRPAQLRDRAQALLTERFGPSEAPAGTAFAYGPAELVSRHAHYFDGFSFLLPLPYGTAVAVRAGKQDGIYIAFEGAPEVVAADTPDPAACLVQNALGEGCFEVAVVGTVVSYAIEAGLASLAVAAMRAQAGDVVAQETGTQVPLPVAGLSAAAEACAPKTLGLGALLAAWSVGPESFALADSGAREVLAVAPPAAGTLGWGLVDTRTPLTPRPDLARRAAQALDVLHEHGMPLDSFAALEHRDLQRALDRLPHDLRSVVRYLVKENQRVPKLVAAVRRGDWQMFGALLLMSHATERADGEGTTPESDCVVEIVEEMSIEGMYGARVSGRGGGVLIAGQPFVVPACLDRIKAHFEARFGRVPGTVLL